MSLDLLDLIIETILFGHSVLAIAIITLRRYITNEKHLFNISTFHYSIPMVRIAGIGSMVVIVLGVFTKLETAPSNYEMMLLSTVIYGSWGALLWLKLISCFVLTQLLWFEKFKFNYIYIIISSLTIILTILFNNFGPFLINSKLFYSYKSIDYFQFRFVDTITTPIIYLFIVWLVRKFKKKNNK